MNASAEKTEPNQEESNTEPTNEESKTEPNKEESKTEPSTSTEAVIKLPTLEESRKPERVVIVQHAQNRYTFWHHYFVTLVFITAFTSYLTRFRISLLIKIVVITISYNYNKK
jgi:hypothetical protein